MQTRRDCLLLSIKSVSACVYTHKPRAYKISQKSIVTGTYIIDNYTKGEQYRQVTVHFLGSRAESCMLHDNTNCLYPRLVMISFLSEVMKVWLP